MLGVLGVLNLVLVVGLAAAWFNPDGSLRNVHWSAPDPVTVDYLSPVGFACTYLCRYGACYCHDVIDLCFLLLSPSATTSADSRARECAD